MRKLIGLLLLISCFIFFGCETLGKEATEGLVYTLNGDNISYTASIGSTFSEKITIAKVYNDKEVTGVYFSGARRIKSVYIPNTIKTIGTNAFQNAVSLEEVVFEEDSKITSIGAFAFSGCYSLSKFSIPSSVTSIGNSAFSSAMNLESITIPGGLTSIGYDAFSGMDSLKKIEVASNNSDYISVDGVLYNKNKETLIRYPQNKSASEYKILEGVEEITNYAFSDVSKLTKVTVPSSVTNLGRYTFTRSKIDTIIFSTGSLLTQIEDDAFFRAVSLKNIILPSTITTIGNNAFYGCISLVSIILPSDITIISTSMFYDCIKLSTIIINPNITSINQNAFYGCISLDNIIIPNNVLEIQTGAFRNSGLAVITIQRDNSVGITILGSNALFNVSEDVIINVPASSLAIYQGAINWSTYATNMQPIT